MNVDGGEPPPDGHGRVGMGDRKPFSQDLQELAVRFAECPVRLRELLEATHGRGFNLLLVLVSLPFLTPIPVPGFSIPFGMMVALIGTRLALGKAPWLPRRLLEKQLPAGFLPRLLGAAGRVVRLLEWLLRPRWMFLHDQWVVQRLAGVLIAISGVFLLLPLPVPLSNGLPAWTVLLLSAAAMERDGLCFVAGCAMFVLTSAFFALLAFGGAQAFDGLRHWLAMG
jgi:hypothetical protein